MNDCGFSIDTPSHRLIEKYIGVSKLHRGYLEEQLRKTGVYRSQHQILMCIAGHPGASQKDIAGFYRSSTATIAVSLKKLEKGGYIKRDVDKGDNRYNQIHITEKGEDLVAGSKKLFQSVEERMFQGFSPEDIKALDSYFTRIQNNLTALAKEAEREDG